MRVILANDNDTFYGTTQHCDGNTFNFSFTILGGEKDDCNAVIQLLQEVYDARHRFRITDSTTAELVKYMENTMLAARVSLCVQFWEIAREYGVSYPELRELFQEEMIEDKKCTNRRCLPPD